MIYSDSHAIAQCHKFLHDYFSNVLLAETASTAFAAKYVKGPKEYGLPIVQRDIHDYHYNTTKFVVLHREGTSLPIQSLFSGSFGDKNSGSDMS